MCGPLLLVLLVVLPVGPWSVMRNDTRGQRRAVLPNQIRFQRGKNKNCLTNAESVISSAGIAAPVSLQSRIPPRIGSYRWKALRPLLWWDGIERFFEVIFETSRSAMADMRTAIRALIEA